MSFYRDILGFDFKRDAGFALAFDMLGVTLRIGKASEFIPARHTVLGWETVDIAASVAELARKGVTFERYPFMDNQNERDERAIHTFPNGDKVAWFKDPDGNILSLSQQVA